MFCAMDSLGRITITEIGITKDLSSQDAPESPFPMWIIIVIIGAALSVGIGAVAIKKRKSGKETSPLIKNDQGILISTREQLEKAAKAAMSSGNFIKAADLYGQCKEVSSKLFKSGVKNEASNSKIYARINC